VSPRPVRDHAQTPVPACRELAPDSTLVRISARAADGRRLDRAEALAAMPRTHWAYAYRDVLLPAGAAKSWLLFELRAVDRAAVDGGRACVARTEEP
jgi:hypothetical protein